MKRIVLAIMLLFGLMGLASAQCSGVFPAGTFCGSIAGGPPKATLLSGFVVGCAQLPALTGDVTSSAASCATTVAKIQGKVVSGTSGTGNVVFSANSIQTGTSNFDTIAAGTISGGPNIVSSGNFIAAATGAFRWLGSSQITSPVDSTILLQNSGLTTFNFLQFGCSTSLCPSLERDSTTLRARLADNSGDAGFSAGPTVITGSFTATNLVTNADLTVGGANTVKVSLNGSTTVDTSLPSCIDSAGQHLNYTSGAGFSCGTTAVSSNMVLLNTLTASGSASLSDTTSITSTYHNYLITLENLLPATNNTTLEFQYHVGAAFISSNYVSNTTCFTTTTTITSNSAYFGLGPAAAVANNSVGVTGQVNLVGVITTNPIQPQATGMTYTTLAGGLPCQCQFGGTIADGTSFTINGFRILFNSGSITSGVVRIYGIT